MISMGEITLKEYLLDCSSEDLCERLMKLDASIMALHQNGFFVVNFDPNHIKLYNGELSLFSFNGKIDRIDSGYNDNGTKQDILEMCAIGICSFNKFSEFYTSKEFITNLIVEFDRYCNNGNIQENMVEYYQDVLINGNIDYLNNFMLKKANQSSSNTQSRGNNYQKTYSTAIGKAFSDKEAAYVNVLIIPALIVLIYFVILTILFFVDK